MANLPQDNQQDANKSVDGFTAPNSPLASETQRGIGAANPPLNWRDLTKLGSNIAQTIKQFTPRGLLPRALLIFLIPVVTLQAGIAYIFYDRYWELVTERLGGSIAGEIAAVIELYEQGRATEFDDAAQNNLIDFAKRNFGLDVTISFDATLPEADDGPLQTFDAFHRIVGTQLRRQIAYPLWVDLYAVNEQSDIRIAVPDQLSEPGTATIFQFQFSIKRLTTSTGYILLLWMIGLTALLSLIAILFLRNQLRPISQLADAAEKFGRGVDPVGFKPSGATEVRTASHAFIKMRQRIDRQINQRTEMLAGISHDLRTPLTRLRLELAILSQANPDDKQSIDHMRADLSDMESMLNDYLEFARGQFEAASDPINIAEMLEALTDRIATSGKPVNLNITEETRGVILDIREVQIRRSIENLINNGCRYGSQVEVSLILLPHHIEIRIEDNGPGIPPDRYEEALRPFSRLDTSRNQDSDNLGSGLGLAIARDIARAHGGDLILNRAELGGLRAAIRLPLTAQSQQTNTP